MKKTFKEISFVHNKSQKFQFDLVSYEDVLNKKPTDHSQFEYHKLSFYAILLFTQRTGKYNLNFNEYDFKKGTLFTLRKNNIHKFHKNKAKGILLVFTEDFILNNATQREASKTFLLFNEMLATPKLELDDSEYKELLSIVSLMQKEYSIKRDDHSLGIFRNYVQIIISKLLRVKSKDNIVFNYNKYLSMFLQFQKLVETECFINKKVSHYAEKMGVTTKTLNNVTQSIINKSVKTFINEIVIIQSKILIINSSKNLTEIAYQVGFEDPTNFFKYFKKYTGLTPKDFRASNQEF